MNLRSLATRDRRALTLGGAAFAPMLLWMLVVAPFMRHLSETHDQLDRSGELLRRELSVVRSARQYAGIRSAVRGRLEESRQRLIYATSDASARATLVGVVDERARASNIDVISVDAAGDSADVGPLRSVSVRLSGTGDMEGILTLLGALEGASPLLVVTQLEIETSNGVAVADISTPVAADSTHARAVVPTRAPETLALRVVVSGFREAVQPAVQVVGRSNRVATR